MGWSQGGLTSKIYAVVDLQCRRVATRYLAAKMRAPERPSFSVRTPQQNRNELGETTLNKTWRKHCRSPKNQNLEDIHCVVA